MNIHKLTKIVCNARILERVAPSGDETLEPHFQIPGSCLQTEMTRTCCRPGAEPVVSPSHWRASEWSRKCRWQTWIQTQREIDFRGSAQARWIPSQCCWKCSQHLLRDLRKKWIPKRQVFYIKLDLLDFISQSPPTPPPQKKKKILRAPCKVYLPPRTALMFSPRSMSCRLQTSMM